MFVRPLELVRGELYYKSISTGAEYVTLYFSHLSFSFLVFSNPIHKTKTRTANK
jgi:hypothetical protein